ncbi:MULTISPECIES: ABC transporter ATP-binding protein [unclassified Ruegeria]|uniref:ABC transporter ATP-binding protein n=1 Tax=unclassified Ruegeria TaxID=2625375 RepID=UPI001489CDE8|nr:MULTISPECIES: sn-glycerol-3-phosphate ABC transporter ATP-binding protein UgpC [unclassified Ruegeria]NOD76674.1 sn-glycerol-3-phosphate ABC transporter ATP-binding protein UgpC [Ruegeria sp. HKCCD4332]NOD89394.1 sn-glycerol-3-phosphate ABC transporter ATP-binding protein UgpC [Ruegeria sp. HKCCD4318]NOE13443.1 sn-glycerol-3-phosphate ABC transporter ATP-binding protein UgpC [Ruegeria sp. HKCCD4318-2]NOG07808.1 sn-glycerol-3-phosphate ABC transporter ATP-binding protein UgpC [Ruegeria sp. HK
MANLSIRSLGKTYPGGVSAVRDVNVEIQDGEFIVLVGPSGCGKSTILRMIAGLETITTGDLDIDGRRVNDLEPGDRDIAMVFQNYALYPHMTVRANMEYGLKNEGLPKDEIAERIAEASRTLRLSDYLDRKPRQLSGGQRQRVAMGRAIVRKPKVFLFDEPLSNLDAKLRTQLRAELKALHARLNGTFIYVTHDQVEAMSLADRIVIMSEGQIEQIGTPMDLYLRPATRFVAEFIGTPAMNFIDATVGSDGHSLQIGEQMIASDAPIQAPAGTSVNVGIRPEHLHRGHGHAMHVKLTTGFVEQLGADTIVHGEVSTNGTPSPLGVRLQGVHMPEPGSELELGAALSDLHLFDAASGRRLNT